METINVPEITVPRLGRILVQKCGNEGNHPYLDETKKVTLKFLRAAIDFIPLALEVAGDLENASFFFAHPGMISPLKLEKKTGSFTFLILPMEPYMVVACASQHFTIFGTNSRRLSADML